jgi:hypothetical protein
MARVFAMGSRHSAKEPVKESRTRWIGAVRPSRQPLCGFLRMRNCGNAINDLPHAESL